MGIEELKKGLKKEMESNCSTILAEANAEKRRIMEESRSQIEQFKSASELKAETILRMIERREIASANITAKKTILNTKKEMVDLVFQDSLQRLKEMPDSERKKIISNLIRQAQKSIEVSVVYCNSKDMRLINGFVVKIDETLDGIICEDKNGIIRMDFTYPNLLNSVREENLKEIAALLF